MLAANRAALQRQSSPDWTQTLLVDSEGIGIAATYERLAVYEPSGDLVWILDDDDICIADDLVKDLQELASWVDFDVIMVKMSHDGHILPDKFTWQKPPQLGHIGVSAFVVKRKIWMKHRSAFAPGAHHSDFNFISAVFERDPDVFWLDVVASATQCGAHGGLPE
jgi:hypothetical protein